MAFRAGGADFAGVKTKKRARERALCVRQNWGHRAKSHFLPLLIRFGPAKPHQTEGTCSDQASQAALRGPKEKDQERWGDPAKADSALPSRLLRIMETARLSNAPASAAGAMLRSCALFSWHERHLEFTPLLVVMAP